MKTMEDILVRFLLLKEYRIYRHFLLIFVFTILSVDIIIHLPGAMLSSSRFWMGSVLYVSTIIGVMYINIFWAIPRLLMKTRLFAYLMVLVGLTIITLGSIYIIQCFIFRLLGGDFDSRFLLNIFSSFSILSLLLAGTTTFVLFRQWLISSYRISELESATLQSELKYLKNQINPHFLFNMLNNVHVLFKDKIKGASSILFKLEDLLRYQINESTKDRIRLSEDIDFLNDYLNLEKVRRDSFVYTIQLEGDITDISLPPLLFIPFVENAVKHSQDSEKESYVKLLFSVQKDKIRFCCENSKPSDEGSPNKPGGIGLKNISRRLELLYPEKYVLQVQETAITYQVGLELNYIKE
ncbi:MAG: histidine kinase [Bacteroides sp.]|nr:histidine kinase [Bacteroides sp.]